MSDSRANSVKDNLMQRAVKSVREQGKVVDIGAIDKEITTAVAALDDAGVFDKPKPTPKNSNLVVRDYTPQEKARIDKIQASETYRLALRIERLKADPVIEADLQRIAVAFAMGSNEAKQKAKLKLDKIIEDSNRTMGHFMKATPPKMYF